VSTILNLSEAVSIALHGMVLLAARHGEVCSNRWIAEQLGVSEAHLSKVLQRLHRVGLVESVRGPKGGFRLTRPPSRITLLQVYEAIEGPLKPATCLFRQTICDGRQCILGDCLKAANRDIKKHLSQTRLSELTDIFPAPSDEA
jgi:Rrf2 family protein